MCGVLSPLDINEIEKYALAWLSVLKAWRYENTAREIEQLLKLWRKSYEKKNSLDDTEVSKLMHSFDLIKIFAARNEFAERVCQPYSLKIFDSIDNMFHRLTHTEDSGLGWSASLSGMFEETSIITNMGETRKKIGILMKVASESAGAQFYIVCFCFLLAMEGYYDELIRLVYMTELAISKKPIPDLKILENKPIDEMYVALKEVPKVITKIWDDGHHIRNAIAHARFYPTGDNDTLRFVDVHPKTGSIKQDRCFTFKEVFELLREVEILGEAVRVLLVLLEIFSVIAIPPDKHYPVIWKSGFRGFPLT